MQSAFMACEVCGTEFEAKPGKRFCSRDCQLKGRGAEAGESPTKRQERVRVIEKLLDENGIDLDDIGSVKAVKLNEWNGFMKGEDGEPRIVDLRAASLVLHPSWETGPKWPVVTQAKPTLIRPAKSRAVARAGWKKAVIMPDLQVGYRRHLTSGALDPFHDLRAIDVAMQLIAAIRPDLIVYLGDGLDLAPFGKYIQEPGFALTIQPAIDWLHAHLSQVRATCPEADIRYIEGNHDLRLQNATIQNAAAAFGIKPANVPDSWPVLSVPFLLRLDELNVEYVAGYPAGATYINDNLACIHGLKVKSAGSTAAQIIDDERVSVIFGHVHRVETVYKTRNTRGKPKFSMAHTPGCLCRLDGVVPGVKAGIDPNGHPVKHFENWQQAISVVDYEDDDGRFHVEPIPIWEGWAMYRGKEYISSVDLRGNPAQDLKAAA